MSLEIRFYIVEKSAQLLPSEDKFYGEIIGVFNYSTPHSNIEKLIDNAKPTDCYIFAEDGNTKIVEDSYEEPLKEIELPDLIHALELEKKAIPEGYRRIMPLLGLLNGFNSDEWENKVVVLSYGY